MIRLLNVEPTPVPGPPPVPIDEGDGGGSWFTFPDWTTILGPLPRILKEAGEKMDRVTTAVSDVMSGKFLKDAIDNLVIIWADESYSPLYSVFEKIYLFTPRIAEIGFVRGMWSVISLLCVIALIIGAAVLAVNVIRGKKDMKTLLKSFIVCIVSTMVSLTVLNMINVIINWITHMALEGIIGTTEIDYTSLSGEEVLKALIVGVDIMIDPSYASHTLGELLAAQGGIIALILHTIFVIFPAYIIKVLIILTLIAMSIFIGFWIAYSAYTGKLEVLVGYLNMYVRTLLAGGLTSLHWAIFVKAQTDYGAGKGIWFELGLKPAVAAPTSVCILMVVLFFLWIRPLWRAVKDPLTLNGGKAVESVGMWSERASKTLHAVGQRLGSTAMQQRGLNFSKMATRMKDAGKRMQESRTTLGQRALSKISGGTSEAIQGVRYEQPSNWAAEAGTIVSVDSMPVQFQGSQVMAAGSHEIAHALKPAGFQASTMVKVADKERADFKKLLVTDDFKNKFGQSVTYKESTGQLLIEGSQSKAVLREMQSAQFTVGNVKAGHAKDGLFVGNNGEVETLSSLEQTKEAMKVLKEKLPAYTKANLSKADASEAHKRILKDSARFPWANKLQMRNDGLWIPESLVEQVRPVLEGLQKTGKHQVRLELPKGSAFLEKMMQDFQANSEHTDLVASLEANVKLNHVLVEKEKVEHFKKAYEAYRRDRTPYWVNRSGKIMVVIDGVPVEYGKAPLKGLDMGSFEELQKEALRKHADKNQ
ncbi:hypothetical protein D3P09_02700 [Paenibacillus pinisoli]|uniref:Uncharacterized protein n=1 Tax=Paenibacillus pinisoli TaxID=1276110 RepID=A0A3A6PIH8_9BACL|nr:hypothetical protein [Paenibacillus pinisoli]RJX40945.1 hypothetical protein D3P09_02700 [Paenibacillus pinisoli]